MKLAILVGILVGTWKLIVDNSGDPAAVVAICVVAACVAGMTMIS